MEDLRGGGAVHIDLQGTFLKNTLNGGWFLLLEGCGSACIMGWYSAAIMLEEPKRAKKFIKHSVWHDKCSSASMESHACSFLIVTIILHRVTNAYNPKNQEAEYQYKIWSTLCCRLSDMIYNHSE